MYFPYYVGLLGTGWESNIRWERVIRCKGGGWVTIIIGINWKG